MNSFSESQLPRLTVGVPVYNGEMYLREALDSLRHQTVEDLEIIVCDNASTDGTEAVVAAAMAIDPRIRYHRSATNRGAAWNFNRTVRLARSPFFCWAAADDLRTPLFAEKCLAALDGSSDAVVAYSQVIDIGPDSTVIKHWGPMPRATADDPIDRFRDVVENERVAFSVFGVMRTDVLRSTRLIAPFAGSDWSLLAELALLGRFVEVEDELFLHREHPDRSTRVHAHSRDRAAWFDTSKAGRATFPYWSLLRAYVRAASVHPTSVRGRPRALAVVASWAWAWKRRLLQELKIGVQHKARPGERS